MKGTAQDIRRVFTIIFILQGWSSPFDCGDFLCFYYVDSHCQRKTRIMIHSTKLNLKAGSYCSMGVLFYKEYFL